MKTKLLSFVLALALVVLFGQAAMSQSAQFQIPITVTSGGPSQGFLIGVSGDGVNPPGTIMDNTIGVDIDPGFLTYQEALAPPPPPLPYPFDARIVTIPGRVSTFPIGLGGGVYTDFRGYFGSAQVDSFKIVISGDDTDNGPTTVSWPSNLNLYGTTWTITPQAGTDWPTTNMLTSTSVEIGAGLHKNIIIIKTGAFSPTPGPTFVLNNSSLNFGTVTVGNSAMQSVTVTNTGVTNALSITGVTPIAMYTVVPNPPGSYPIAVAPGASRTFDVTFSPTAAGTAAGDIVFAHNATGGTTNLAVTGIGSTVPTQGGTLQFASVTRTRFDNTVNFADSFQLASYVGVPLKALQLQFVTHGLVIIRSVGRGNDIPSPAFSFSSVIARGPVNGDGSTNDTVKVVIYGNGTNALAAGTYNSLVRFSYDVVNISDPDVQTTTVTLQNVFGSGEMGEDAGVSAGPLQTITVNNRTLLGDVNNDDRVDILDMLMIVDHILNRITLTGDAFIRANVAPWGSPDGVVNVQDLALVQWIILNNQYPDGSPLSKPVVPPIIAGNGLGKLNPGVDAKLTFYMTAQGIAVRLENAKQVKGMQLEFGNISSVPGNLAISTLLGEGFGKLVNQVFRVLLYNQAGTVIEPGDQLVANIPFSLVNPLNVTLENIVVADADNKKLGKVDIEISLDSAPELPVDFSLSQNYPNPFNPTTNIRFSVPQTSDVRISIYNTLGQEVRTLFAGSMERGTKEVQWDGRNTLGNTLSSGLYVYRMTAGSFSSTKKMLLMK